jgi:hypothetical protein
MFVPCISDVLEEKNQQYALIVPSFIYFYVLASTCFGSSLPSSRSLLDPPELLENANWGFGISYNVWLRGLCAELSWFCVLCVPTQVTQEDPISSLMMAGYCRNM